jgi:hypothetical protein
VVSRFDRHCVVFNVLGVNKVYESFPRCHCHTSCAGCTCHPQSQAESEAAPKWQTVDLQCGQLKVMRPRGLFESHLEYADVKLYPARRSQNECCRDSPIATTKSGLYGAFELTRVKKGRYWLRVIKGKMSYTVPLNVTEDSNSQRCHVRGIGRIFILDSDPPKVETRT